MGTSPARYRFADLTLDVGQRRLSRGEETVALSKLTFALLNALVEASPNVVTHAELAEKVWGPRRIVTPENLAKRVMRLREALGDSADAPRYVEGLRGQGYRLIPSVESIASEVGTAEAPAPMPVRARNTAPPRASTPRRLAVAATIALAAVVAVGGYRFSRPLGAPAEAGVFATHAPKIVVLPFTNLSSDPEHRHFADGLTDELIISLQRLPGVKVMSSTTSFAVRDSHHGAKEIAADLDVQFVLEGSVGIDGERLRVRAQLTDATGFGVLPYSYEGTLDNLFAVQDEIVGAIAAAMRAPLGLEPAVARAGTSHVEAYELYLAAKLECTEGHKTPEGFERALRLIDRAIAIDPKFARAWMFKSLVHSMRAAFTPGGGEAEIATAEEAATRAIGLAPDNSDGYNARAMLRLTSGDWRGAAADYVRVQSMSDFPQDIPFILSLGQFGKARERIKGLLEADPLNEDLLAFLVVADEVLRQPGEADEAFRRGRLLYEQWEFGDRVGVWVREGRKHVEPPYDHIALPQPFGDLAERGDAHPARVLLERALADPQNQTPTTIGNLAIWAASHGDKALALKLLREATVGAKTTAYIAWLPVFEEARRLPEFKVLLVDLGLVDYWRATGWPDVCRPSGEHDFDCI